MYWSKLKLKQNNINSIIFISIISFIYFSYKKKQVYSHNIPVHKYFLTNGSWACYKWSAVSKTFFIFVFFLKICFVIISKSEENKFKTVETLRSLSKVL